MKANNKRYKKKNRYADVESARVLYAKKALDVALEKAIKMTDDSWTEAAAAMNVVCEEGPTAYPELSKLFEAARRRLTMMSAIPNVKASHAVRESLAEVLKCFPELAQLAKTVVNCLRFAQQQNRGRGSYRGNSTRGRGRGRGGYYNNNNNNNANAVNSSGYANSNGEKLCWKCSQTGHMSYNCPQGNSSGGNSSQEKK